jgi:hypothetical protein
MVLVMAEIALVRLPPLKSTSFFPMENIVCFAVVKLMLVVMGCMSVEEPLAKYLPLKNIS